MGVGVIQSLFSIKRSSINEVLGLDSGPKDKCSEVGSESYINLEIFLIDPTHRRYLLKSFHLKAHILVRSCIDLIETLCVTFATYCLLKE